MPSASLFDRLQTAVESTYRLEKELGGGGMSRVFLAEEVRLGRQVVIKVLPPEMAAGVNVERFQREIQLAARLQHPHVVPLLTAGAADDLLYYVMPFIEGESLRAKLGREGELPVGEAARILRDVSDALAYAHGRGVVHRDIKPDNVLLTGGHAVVTDFGVAKAVSSSTGESSLTSLGVALGTPAYMSPEQAAADPHVDHRADIYAVGAMAYEMLCGRPPFTAPTAQAVLSAHVTQTPEPLTAHRDTVPPAFNELVLRCLAKKAADRWQRAEEVKSQLDAMLTPSGGLTPTATQPVASVDQQTPARAANPVRVTALFGLASLGMLALVYGAVQVLGLPGWVFWGAIGLLVAGLPIMLLTGHHERRRASAATTGLHVTTPAGLPRYFTWQRAILGGGLAFAALAVVATAYMLSRVLGIGPGATLVSAGVLEERSRVLLVEFENRTDDEDLGYSVTDLVRVDLAQSSILKLVDQAAVEGVLRRMARDPATRLDVPLAREIAEREGIPAVVMGEIGRVGASYTLTANLLSATDGEVLVAVRERADDDAQIIDAVDRLSAKLRERIGESLRTIRRATPLDRVTTSSLDALRRLAQAQRAEDQGDYERAIALLEEAVTLDTAFAMAYRKLAVVLGNSGAENMRIIDATTKAFAFRDRLPELERYLAEAYYYNNVDYDVNRVIAAYRSALEVDPDNTPALNNLALAYSNRGDYAAAEPLARRALALENSWPFYVNAIRAQFGQGKAAAVDSTLALMEERLPESPWTMAVRGYLASARGDDDRATAAFQSLADGQRDPFWRDEGNQLLAAVAEKGGRLREAQRRLELASEAALARGVAPRYLETSIWRARIDAQYRRDSATARTTLQAALARQPLSRLPAADRPYSPLATFYARVGDLAAAKRLMTEYEAAVPEEVRRGDAARHAAAAAIAMREGRFDDAVESFTAWNRESILAPQGLFELGQALERAGRSDSALAVYERAATSVEVLGVWVEASALGPTLERLAALYEERDDANKAIDYASRLVDLWKDSDPELQPLVREARERIARLAGERR